MRHLFLLSVFLLPGLLRAQTPEYAFRVYFSNKAATSYSLNNPAAFLSQRALERRTKYNITVDSSDLPVNQIYIDSVLQRTGGRLHCLSRWNNTVVILVTDSTAVNTLSALPFFRHAQLVAFYPMGLAAPAPSLPSAGKPTGFDENFYAAAWAQIHLCHGEYLHQQGHMGENMLIALIDAGFEGVDNLDALDSMRAENRLEDRWNFVHDTDETDNEGAHGTETFSCIAGYLPGVFVGTAPKASYALYTTEDLLSEQPIEEDNWTAAAERADSLGADIITTSLGYNTFDPPFPDYVYNDLDGQTTYAAAAANEAARKGILVIASAGNEGITPWQHILTPGDADSALTVGAVDAQMQPAPSTGKGPNASGKIKPDVAAQGVNTAVITANGAVTQVSGTSFSTPVIAGLSACLMQVVPQSAPAHVKEIIRSVSSHAQQPDNQTGYGVPDFEAAYNDITGIREPGAALQDTFRIAPNPAGDYLYLRGTLSRATKISILTYTGKTLKTIFPGKGIPMPMSIPVRSLPPGLYFLEIQSGYNNRITRKFVKQ